MIFHCLEDGFLSRVCQCGVVQLGIMRFSCSLSFILLPVLFFCFSTGLDLKNVEKLSDQKELKKLLRVRKNVLILFTDSSVNANSVKKAINIVAEAANLAVGQGTVAVVDCHSDEAKKFCKKLKISPHPVLLKHYHNGEYHKDYDRPLTPKSIYRFLINPTGDAPWDEDPTASNVVHVENKAELQKMIFRSKRALVLFYAPWCGHCKRLKPEFSAAASELNGDVVLAGMDLTLPGNDEVSRIYQVEGYPTLEYFEGGKHRFRYSGEYSKNGIVSWLKNPSAKPVESRPEEDEIPWSEVSSDIEHLTDDTFDNFIKSEKSVLVMFYAPWCGHCKKAKPEYSQAAERLRRDGVSGRLAAVDATEHRRIAEKYGIEGFPTFKYFKDGKFAWNIDERTESAFYNFMKDPMEPPPPESPWKEQPGNVMHLTAATFRSELKKKKNALVMFYAPWCGHCKRAKPFFVKAANKLAHDSRIMLAAVDCTEEKSLCQENDVKGFPTFIYLSYGKGRTNYNGPHSAEAFADFVTSGGQIVLTRESPTFDFSSSVKIVGADNYDAVTSSGETLMMFYEPWCSDCKSAKLAFSEAAERTEQGNFAAVDCSVHSDICNRNSVSRYPAFKLIVDGVSRNYVGDRTAEGFSAVFAEAAHSKKTEL